MWRYINFIATFWWVVGLIVGIQCNYRFGFQSRFVGWPLIIVTEILVWRAELWRDGLVFLLAINLGLIALFSLYFQMKDEEVGSQTPEPEVFDIRLVFPHNGPLNFWIGMSISIYSAFGGFGAVLAPLQPGNLALVLISCLAAMAAILISVRFTGGIKGGFWKVLSEALKARGGILPRPTFF